MTRDIAGFARNLQLGEQKRHAGLAAIAGKSVKEARYHLQHSRDWLVRLGDGTNESHQRMQSAIDHLYPYTREFWSAYPAEAAAIEEGVAADIMTLQSAWNQIVDDALWEATLAQPPAGGYVSEGKKGIHSEHLGYLLAEMQSLSRALPDARW